MEIEGYDSIISTLTLAKELHDIGRYDIVQKQFFDTLCYDTYYENLFGVISSIFDGCHNSYDDGDEYELMIFTDDYISRYFEIAWEYGRSHNVRHDDNPYVLQAKNAVSRWLSFCYSMDFKLLGYTKTRKAARRSKLLVYVGMCDCDCHGSLARGLVELYQFFRDKCEEFDKRMEAMAFRALTIHAPIIQRKGLMAA